MKLKKRISAIENQLDSLQTSIDSLQDSIDSLLNPINDGSIITDKVYYRDPRRSNKTLVKAEWIIGYTCPPWLRYEINKLHNEEKEGQ